MTHIEEPDALSHDDLQVLARDLCDQKYDVAFAYDTLLLEV
jgi:hypothetical protein